MKNNQKDMMIKRLLNFGLFLLTTSFAFGQQSSQGYNIKLKIEGLTDSAIYLANYFGAKLYYKDTALVKPGGMVEFSGDKPLIGGIYTVILGDKTRYFEFVVNEPTIELSTVVGDMNVMTQNMKVKSSKENEVFFSYMKFIADKQKEVQPLKTQLESATGKDKEAIQEKINKIDGEVKDFQKNLVTANPNSFFVKVLSTTKEPDVPEPPKTADGKVDSTFQFRYFKSHYMDNVDFSDERLLHTPILANKIDFYLKKLTLQIPDSIIESADYLVEKAKSNQEIFKYVVHTITNEYEQSKIMGMDIVFVHMAETYYLTTPTQAFWMDSAKLAKVKERVDALKPTLLGKQIPNIILQDTSGKWVDLYKDVKTKYTIVYFWDSGCGHCKKATPALKEYYDKVKNSISISVFAVGTELETGDWKKFISEHDLNFINVSDTPELNKNAYKYIGNPTTLESLNFRSVFDIYSTPVVVILDQDKKVIAKRLGVEQIEEFINDYEKLHNTSMK